ncbi:MAG: hypothetical protein ACOYNY_08815 [Caldilineaceae bacterium]
MSDKFLNELSFTEFDQLLQNHIERAEPDDLTIDVFQTLVDESNQPPVDVVLTGVIKDNELELHIAEPTNAPLRVHGNEILLHNLRLIIHLPTKSATVVEAYAA